MTKQQEQIVRAAAGILSDPIVAAVVANPRGTTMAIAGGGVLGGMGVKKQTNAAAEAGLVLGNVVALTASSLVTMRAKVGMTGDVKSVDEVLSTVPLTEVEELEAKRMGLAGGSLHIQVHGHTFKVEGKLGDLKGFAEAFAKTKAGAAAS